MAEAVLVDEADAVGRVAVQFVEGVRPPAYVLGFAVTFVARVALIDLKTHTLIIIQLLPNSDTYNQFEQSLDIGVVGIRHIF